MTLRCQTNTQAIPTSLLDFGLRSKQPKPVGFGQGIMTGLGMDFSGPSAVNQNGGRTAGFIRRKSGQFLTGFKSITFAGILVASELSILRWLHPKTTRYEEQVPRLSMLNKSSARRAILLHLGMSTLSGVTGAAAKYVQPHEHTNITNARNFDSSGIALVCGPGSGSCCKNPLPSRTFL